MALIVGNNGLMAVLPSVELVDEDALLSGGSPTGVDELTLVSVVAAIGDWEGVNEDATELMLIVLSVD